MKLDVTLIVAAQTEQLFFKAALQLARPLHARAEFTLQLLLGPVVKLDVTLILRVQGSQVARGAGGAAAGFTVFPRQFGGRSYKAALARGHGQGPRFRVFHAKFRVALRGGVHRRESRAGEHFAQGGFGEDTQFERGSAAAVEHQVLERLNSTVAAAVHQQVRPPGDARVYWYSSGKCSSVMPSMR